MATPYEVEHNIKDKPQGQTRRPDMSSFFNQISQISTASTEQETHNNAHATPTPVEMAAAHRLLREQYETLLQNAGGREMNQELLERLIAEEEAHIDNPPEKVEGVPQSYLDTLERVDKRRLKKTDTCPICAEPFLDDPYPLVVRLPCHDTHLFDLECVGPWLRLNGTCPLDRKDLMKKKEVPKKVEYDDDEEEDNDMMYA